MQKIADSKTTARILELIKTLKLILWSNISLNLLYNKIYQIMKRLTFFALVMVLAVTACEKTEPIAVSGIAFDKTTLNLTIGNSTTLVATISPDNASNKRIIWSSSAESVATVNASGKINAVSVGTTTITAKTTNGESITCEVTVYKMVAGSKTGLLSWVYTDDGTLIISGEGEMPTYSNNTPQPWIYHREAIRSVIIEDGVTTIGQSAFWECIGLTNITIPNSVTIIGGSAFDNCQKLMEITIPNSVTTIGGAAFSGCVELTSITIPNSVTTIGDAAFSGCVELTNITIPNSVTTIGRHAFWHCGRLTDVTIPNSVTAIGGWAFAFCDELTSITMSNGVTIIEDMTFAGCANLTEVIIPNSVHTIREWAFGGCSGLTSITIPYGVTTIQVGAFENCENLIGVTIMAKMPSAIDRRNNFMSNNDTLYVPVGCTTAYRNSTWGELFTTITEQ